MKKYLCNSLKHRNFHGVRRFFGLYTVGMGVSTVIISGTKALNQILPT